MRVLHILFFVTVLIVYTVGEEHTYVNKDNKDALFITVVMAGRNVEKTVADSIRSVTLQDYPPDKFRIFYVDDASTDSTYEKLKEIKEKSNIPIHIIESDKHLGPAYGRMEAIKRTDDEDIIVLVDGDDYLIHDKALAMIHNEYVQKKIWVSFGGHVKYPGWNSIGYSSVRYTRMRKEKRHSFAHMRTFYSWLAKKINDTDLKDPEGNYYQGATDISIILPIVEMAHDANRIHRFPDKDPMYVYMVSTQTFSKDLVKRRREMAESVFAKPPYKRVSHPPLTLPAEGKGLLEIYPRTPTSKVGEQAIKRLKLRT